MRSTVRLATALQACALLRQTCRCTGQRSFCGDGQGRCRVTPGLVSGTTTSSHCSGMPSPPTPSSASSEAAPPLNRRPLQRRVLGRRERPPVVLRSHPDDPPEVVAQQGRRAESASRCYGVNAKVGLFQ
jgi:hypothetical protein